MPKSFRTGIFTVAFIPGIGKVWIKGGSIKIFFRIFFVSQCRKIPQGSLLLLHQFWVPKEFGEEVGGGSIDYLSKLFCLTVPKISVVESFTVAIISGSEKVYGQGERRVSWFSVEISLSHSVEKLRRGILYCVALISGTENFGEEGRGVSRYSVGSFLSHSPEKGRRLYFSNSLNSGIEKTLGINRKNIWHDRDSNPKPAAWEGCRSNSTVVFDFWIKRVGSFALKKKRKQILPHCTLYWMNNFSCKLHMWQKIISTTY